MDVKMSLNKGGQLAIWVILAIVLVASIAIFFTFENRAKTNLDDTKDFDPQRFIEKCIRNEVEGVVDLMIPNAGFVQTNNSRMYEGKNVSYLCRNDGNYYPCINQHPMLLNEMKDEIKVHIAESVNSCFDNLKSESGSRGYGVELPDETSQFEVILGPDKIIQKVMRKVILTKGSETDRYEEFDIEIASPLYNLGFIASEIASQESKYCYFEYVGYMVLYPRYDIKKFTLSESTKIYTIKDKKTGREMKIAIRGCAVPAGI